MNIRKNSATAATLLLATVLLSSMTACGDTATTPVSETQNAESATEAVTTEEIDPFADFDFGGEEIRILVSNNDYDGLGSSSYLIINEEEETGDIVKDAVYQRNKNVEELLNVKFTYTKNEDDYNSVPKNLGKPILAGDDAYDLMIHDLFPFATMSVQGYFLNAKDGKYFDFTKDYWYSEYMTDLAFGSEDKAFILAGDYFMDVIRCAHALYFNKDIFSNLYESPSELYQHVYDGTWTIDTFLSYVADAYSDVNGDGTKDAEDIYGYGYVGKWGSMIPWVISSDADFLSFNDDGSPYFDMNTDHNVTLLQRLNDIFYSDGAYDYTEVEKNTAAFFSGTVLFGGYQRIMSLETFREMTAEIGVLPYPKFDESQEKYITSSHDTANVGVIPMTCSKLDTLSAVLEVLSRETNKSVMPAYYETALKIKYSRDDDSAKMLDIIRDGISCVFPVAYGNYCNNTPLYNLFSAPLASKKTDFASVYAKYEAKAQTKLDELWEAFSEVGE